MPEDPIAQGEIAALTRRFEAIEAQNNREFGIIKSELTTLNLKASNTDQKLDQFIQEQRAANARIIEMLATLSTKDTQ
jgi:hypothetical protein